MTINRWKKSNWSSNLVSSFSSLHFLNIQAGIFVTTLLWNVRKEKKIIVIIPKILNTSCTLFCFSLLTEKSSICIRLLPLDNGWKWYMCVWMYSCKDFFYYFSFFCCQAGYKANLFSLLTHISDCFVQWHTKDLRGGNNQV